MPEDQQPTPASENEISDYYEGMKKLEIEGYENGIKKARTALFVTAGILLVSELITAGSSPAGLTPALIGIAVLEAAVFVGLGFWTKTKPLAAIITGLIIFILMWVASAAVYGVRGAVGGILIRVIIIVYLASAIKPAKAWEEVKKR